MPRLQTLNHMVPITAFNRGKAGQIFSDVKKTGLTVVIKNNEPECVLLSPHDYNALIERLEDAELLAVAEKRMQTYDASKNVPFEDVCKENGINPETLDTNEVEFE